MQTVVTPTSIVGQELALQLLQAALRQQRITTAYCFVGPSGIGRALTARWFTQALLCQDPETIPCGQCRQCRLVQQGSHPDSLWVEPTYQHQGKLLTATEATDQQLQRRSPPQIRLEQIQGIVTFAARRPLQSQRSVIVVTGCETLAESAANALLKTLEEPGQAVVILLTPSLADLLPTLVSRCQVIPFRRLSQVQVTKILQQQGHSPLSPVLLSLAQGSPGAALNALEQQQQIPADLLDQLHDWPQTLTQCLILGRMITKTLDVPSQLWLIDYLQHHIWQHDKFNHLRCAQSNQVKQLEQIRRQLLSFVQPQLAWEMNLSCLALNRPLAQI